MAYFKNEYQFSNGHPQQIVVFFFVVFSQSSWGSNQTHEEPIPARHSQRRDDPRGKTFTPPCRWGASRSWSRRRKKKPSEGLTDHVDGGSSRPHPWMLLDGVVESGLTQLNGRHTDPEAQAEQPRHDRTHLLKTGRGGVKKNTSCSSTYDLMPLPKNIHASAHTHSESSGKIDD